MKIIHFVSTCCTILMQIQVVFSDPCPQLNLLNGKVRLRSRGRVAKFRCDSSYQLVGNKTGTCIRGTWDTSTPLCIRNDCPPIPKTARNGYWIENYKGASYTLVCNDGYKLQGTRVIYCHNQRWSDIIPFCDEIRTSCDFEKEDLCGWTQNKSNFTWIRHSHATPSSHLGTGPSFDHTLGEDQAGHYMFIESSSPFSENDTAQLFSPVYDSQLSKKYCFIFWYHMHGTTMGDLNVYQKLQLSATNMTRLYHKSGDQGNKWLLGIMNLTSVNNPFQIVIEAIRGRSYMSDIAIDDVKLTKEEDCLIVTTKTSNLPTTQITVTSPPLTAEPAISISKTMKSYVTFLPPPPLPTLPPLPTFPPLPLPPLLPPLRPLTTVPLPTSLQSLSSLPSLTSVVPFVTSTSAMASQTFSQVNFNLSTVLTYKTTGKITTTHRPETTHSTSRNDSTLNSSDINKSITGFLKTTPAVSSNMTTQEQHIPITSRKSQFSRPSTVTPYKPVFSTQMLTSTKSDKMSTWRKTSLVPSITIVRAQTYSSILTATNFKHIDKIYSNLSPTNLMTTVSNAKYDSRHKTESQTYLPTQRTTLKIDVKPSVKRGYRTTVEPATKIKESKAEPKVSHVSSIAGAVGGVFAVAIIAALLVFVLSRRITRFKKHRDMSEDSDVRFLTSDEVLDFNLARPSDDDDL